jgi:hypothetical protein
MRRGGGKEKLELLMLWALVAGREDRESVLRMTNESEKREGGKKKLG